MKNLHVYIRPIARYALAGAFLLPAIGWTHGAVDIPIARQVKCNLVGGIYYPEDGSGIADAGCRAAALKFSTPSDRAYQLTQWNEVAKLIKEPDYNNDEIVKASIPDGQLCSAGDPKKAGLDVVTPDWYKTSVVPKNGKMQVRIIGTAPHVPSFVKVYLSKPSYTGAAALKWNDLTEVYTERFEVARTDWTTPSTMPGTSGFFQFEVPIPAGQTGNAVLYTRWQRVDPAGEGFYNCSDITIDGPSNPFPWFEKGTFVSSDKTPKVDDSVRFRVLGHGASAAEVVDIKVPITSANLAPAVWGKQLADQLASKANIIKVGIRSGNNVVFDPSKIHDNLIYLANEKDSPAMSIIDGGANIPEPGTPTAVITGPRTIKGGEKLTLSGKDSTGHNGPLTYSWTSEIPPTTAKTVDYTATAPTDEDVTSFDATLVVYDAANKKTDSEKVNIAVTHDTGATYPPYVAGTKYGPGEKVTNEGKNYSCKEFPFSGWCGQGAGHYEPGKGSNWKDAWDPID